MVPLGSSGTCFTVSGQTFKSKKSKSFHSKRNGVYGFGLPSTIGASLSMNNKRSVTIIGDGGFQLNVQELQTIYANNIKAKIFVFKIELPCH